MNGNGPRTHEIAILRPLLGCNRGSITRQKWSQKCDLSSGRPQIGVFLQIRIFINPQNGLGASHRVDSSSPETTTIVQSDVRGSSSTPWERLKTQAWSARTPRCAFKSPSPVQKLAHGAQLPPKMDLAPRTQSTQVHQNRLR